MSNPNASYLRTPWWEHVTTTTSEPAPSTTSTTAAPEPTSTVEQPTTTVAPEPTTTVEAQPNSIHIAVSTPLPQVDAVVVELAPPVSYAAPPTLPHTGSETVATAGIGGLLVAVGLICTALAARTRKATR